MKLLKYRPDIDGLRAVAVLGVIIYHAFPTALPGGFTGVDIFFVISGYLISGILYTGVKEENFSFVEFYARRVKRLFPALITVMILTMALGYWILLSDEYVQLGKHLAAGCLFIQNIVYWQESGYFDTAANLKPLLHLWSLAVEEQFYIFFPPILLLIWKRKWPLAAIIAVLLVISMVANLVMSVQNRTSDFFLTPYRGWEFLGGALLAWWHYGKGHEEEVPVHAEVLSATGLLLLGAGMIFLHKEAPFPGWRALFPVVGTLMLMEGGRGAWVNKRFLTHQWVVWVGLISYPLYLFHWPLLSFLHILRGEQPPAFGIVAVLGLSLILSAGTYYLLERKIRRSTSKLAVPLLVAFFFAVGLVGVLAWQNVIVPRSSKLGFDENLKAAQDNDFFKGSTTTHLDENFSTHEFGGSGSKTLYIGDSHMEQCASRIIKLIQSKKSGNRGAIFLTRAGFVPIPDIQCFMVRSNPEFFKVLNNYKSRTDIDRLVISANWCYYFNWGGEKQFSSGHTLCSAEGMNETLSKLGNLIREFTREGKRVFLILNIPTSDLADPKLMLDRDLDGEIHIKQWQLTVKEFRDVRGKMPISQGELMDKMVRIGIESGAEIINPMDYLSSEGVCLRFYENKPMYHDGSHLRAEYVRDHALYLDKTILP